MSDSVICHTCATANLKGLLHLDTRSESSFLSDGFRNWKNALCKTKGFHKHEGSLCHKHAVSLLTQSVHIDEQLKEQLKSQKEENRNCLLKIVQSISYLARQGIAFRKGKQEEESNFKQLLLLQAENDAVLQKWIGKSYDKHFNPDAQNEILQIIALKVLRGIASDMAESGYYSIMADETTDASNIEQLVICMRWVDKETTVHEDYIGLMPIAQTNANTIVSCINDVLLRMNLRIQDARGQFYDGCSTMTGTKNGVASQIKKLNEKCLLTHCYCHSLNLAVGDTIKNIPLLKDVLDIAYEITKLIKKSPKREAEFRKKQAEIVGQMEHNLHVDIDSPTLKILCPTRWTIRAASLSAILKNYGTLMKLWDWSQDNVSDSDMKARIIGVQTKMQSFSFFYGLQLAILVLSHSDNLSTSLQRAELCAVDAQQNAKLSVTVLRGIRTDRDASLLWTTQH